MMRQTFFVVALGLAGFTSSALAKELPEPEEKVTPRSYNFMLTLPGGLAAEMKVMDSLAAGIYVEGGSSVSSGGRKSSSNDDRTDVTSRSAGIQAHWTLMGPALSDGWYVEPYLGVMKQTYKSSATHDSTTGKGLAVGALFGYGWFWSPGFNIQLGLGVREYAMKVDNSHYIGTDNTQKSYKTGRTTGFGAAAEVAFGWAI